MIDRINALPELLSQAPELQDRMEMGLCRRFFQKVDHLLSQRTVLPLGAFLKTLV